MLVRYIIRMSSATCQRFLHFRYLYFELGLGLDVHAVSPEQSRPFRSKFLDTDVTFEIAYRLSVVQTKVSRRSFLSLFLVRHQTLRIFLIFRNQLFKILELLLHRCLTRRTAHRALNCGRSLRIFRKHDHLSVRALPVRLVASLVQRGSKNGQGRLEIHFFLFQSFDRGFS